MNSDSVYCVNTNEKLRKNTYADNNLIYNVHILCYPIKGGAGVLHYCIF